MTTKSISTGIYQKLVRRPGYEQDQSLEPAARPHVPGNFLLLLLSQFLTQLGDAISNPKIVLPWIMGSVGAPLYQLGFLVPIRESGSLLPQLVIAEYLSRCRLRKWFWIAGSIFQALAIAAIGLVAWLMTGATAGWCIIVLLIGFSLARGFSSTAAKDILGKTIPKSQRGEVNGWSASLSGLVTLVLAVLLLLHRGSPLSGENYGSLIIIASLLWLLAALIFTRIREFPGEAAPSRKVLHSVFERAGILITDKPFRRFVITRSLLLCSALTAPYYVALAQKVLGAPVYLLGLFILASGGAGLLSGPVWGKFSDISSAMVMAVGSIIAAGLGLLVCLLYWFAPQWLTQPWLLPVVYFLLTVAHQGVRIGRKTYVVDMADGNRRTDYVSVSNTVIGVVLLLVGGLGALTSLIDLSAIILLLSLFGLAGAAMAIRLGE